MPWYFLSFSESPSRLMRPLPILKYISSGLVSNISVKWATEENSENSYLARIYLKGTDRIGMINDITRITSKVLGVNIRRFNIGTEDGIFDGFIDLYVHDIDVLDRLISRLLKIRGIESVVKKEL